MGDSENPPYLVELHPHLYSYKAILALRKLVLKGINSHSAKQAPPQCSLHDDFIYDHWSLFQEW